MADIIPPAQIAPIVEALGEDSALRFLIKFGGAELSLSLNPKKGSKTVREFGFEIAKILGRLRYDGILPDRIPLGREWVIKVLDFRGFGTAEIARKLSVADVTVRRNIHDQCSSQKKAPQGDFFAQ